MYYSGTSPCRVRMKMVALMRNILSGRIVGICAVILFPQLTMAQWVQTNATTNRAVLSFAVSGGNVFAGTLGGGVFRSTDGGANWSSVDTVSKDWFISSLALNGNNVFAGSLNPLRIFLSTNGGASWTAVYTGDQFSSLAVSGNNIFAGTTTDGVLMSVNNGASWTRANSGLPAYASINCLVTSGNNIFAGTRDSGVFVSSISGVSWTTAISGLPDIFVRSLAVSGNNLLAGSDSGVSLCTKNGATWTVAGSGLANIRVMSLAVSGNNVFAGTADNGVFVSTNNGTSWTDFSTGLTDITDKLIYSLAICGTNLLAGTDYSGIWRRPLSDVGVINPEPLRMMIQQANLKTRSLGPVGINVAIDFFLPHSDQVSIRIYNLSGHEISSLVSKYLESGPHSIIWNTRNISAGCYIAKMRAGSTTLVKSVPLFR